MATRAARRVASSWVQCRGMGHVPLTDSSAAKMDSLVPMKEGEVIRWGGKTFVGPVLGKLNLVKLEYKARVKELRKEFMKEVEEKRIEKQRTDVAGREKLLQEREQKRILHWQRKEEKRLRAQEEHEALRVILENQRLIKADSREKQLAKHKQARDKKLESLRESSCTWIEEKDLEGRIHEAMVDPIRLIGPLGHTDGLENYTVADRSSNRHKSGSEDPLLRDDDDELLGAFGRRNRVSGQDILASAVKATRAPF